MNPEFKSKLQIIVQEHSEELIQEWIEYVDAEYKDDEHRHYDDFLGFFEECIESDLNPHSDEALALKHFLKKLQEIVGEEFFFNFHGSIYTCYLKFPLLHMIEQKELLSYENIKTLTHFFESLTSNLILEILRDNKKTQESSFQELEEREAPISEIWDGVLLLSIVGTLDSNRILQIIDKVLLKLQEKEYSSVIVDISSIFDMNSEVANQIIKLNNSVHYMGVTPYISGITANIAKSLTHLNISLGDVRTYATTKKAMQAILQEK
jgi:anti-anti-sigma regulatory factor